MSRRCRTRGRGSATTSSARSAGSCRPPAGSTRSSRSRRRACAAAGRFPRRWPGSRSSSRLRVLPFSHRFRMAWSRRGRPPLERFLGPVDVLHFSDWMYPPQRGGVRATTIHDLVPLRFPEWVTARTREMHGEKYAEHRAHLRRDLHELGVHCERRRRAPRRAARARPRRAAGAGHGFSPEGRRAELGGPYVLGVGTLEPRKNLGRLVEAWRLLDGDLVLALAGGEGWGEQPQLGGSRHPSARLRPRRRAAGVSIEAPRSSSIRRCSRASASRSSRRWPAGHRSSRRRIPRWTRPAATRPCARIRTIRTRSPLPSPRRSAAATSSCRRGSRTPPGSPGARSGETFLRGLRGGACASGLTRARSCRRRRDGAPRPRAAAGARGRRSSSSCRSSYGGSGRRVDGCPRRGLVSDRHRARLGAFRRPPLHDVSRAVSIAGAGRR